MDIEGRNAVVTGGASGLGRATVLALARAGARVAVLDRDGDAARQVAEQCDGDLLPVEVDVADEQSVDRAFSAIKEKFGTVHLCVNAAGVATAGKVVSKGQALPLATFRTVIEVNLIGLFDVLRRCSELMAGNDPGADGERGVIINVSSGAAWQGQKGQAAYSASKAGVIGLMLPVARDLAAHGIRVVTIAPGLFQTGMSAGMPEKVLTALEQMVLYPQRLGDPAEFAELVGHIVTNRYLNAATLSIDAGARLT
ncbi:SDR family NAD(P)-dependent oxidoreductase [Thermocrispum municipale]|jgi:NAD(P)-dependent dehydrogenase (short-subunit alcohol dehydrogenase family)|uniref:SDR family NAD(P)-dependent oxidoreductase n=1 Tax=Thermocrispum municipale TaxID=37926 RepID=UPI00042120A4|nr:SDR family NAD(P)-dependent oxidoreductase [Thermocrispum municipale]